MKTFLWTTFFWIVVIIAALLCLGFGNFGTQVLENGWLASVMPKNLKAESCDTVLETTLQDIDWCAAAEANNCVNVETETNDLSESDTQIQESLINILASQELMYKEMQESFSTLNTKIDGVNNIVLSDNAKEALLQSLQTDLDKAIAEERYEDAANLRDKIKELGE